MWGCCTSLDIAKDKDGKRPASPEELARLDLHGTLITDATSKQLKQLKSLETLSIAGTQITDAGLKELTGLMNLREN